MRKTGLLVFLTALVAVSLAWGFQSSQLFIKGSLASSGLIERNGVAYVPVKDVAAALNLSVQKTSRGYELSETGGANQVQGQTGKIGDMLFNGFIRFQVIKVIRTHTYTCQFDPNHREINPIPSGDDLAVIVCKIKNGTQKSLYPNLAEEDLVSVTDTDGHSFHVRRFGDFPASLEMLPGAAIDYALVFDVPPGLKLQDLVYCVTAGGVPGIEKKKFRISLAEG